MYSGSPITPKGSSKSDRSEYRRKKRQRKREAKIQAEEVDCRALGLRLHRTVGNPLLWALPERADKKHFDVNKHDAERLCSVVVTIITHLAMCVWLPDRRRGLLRRISAPIVEQASGIAALVSEVLGSLNRKVIDAARALWALVPENPVSGSFFSPALCEAVQKSQHEDGLISVGGVHLAAGLNEWKLYATKLGIGCIVAGVDNDPESGAEYIANILDIDEAKLEALVKAGTQRQGLTTFDLAMVNASSTTCTRYYVIEKVGNKFATSIKCMARMLYSFRVRRFHLLVRNLHPRDDLGEFHKLFGAPTKSTALLRDMEKAIHDVVMPHVAELAEVAMDIVYKKIPELLGTSAMNSVTEQTGAMARYHDQVDEPFAGQGSSLVRWVVGARHLTLSETMVPTLQHFSRPQYALKKSNGTSDVANGKLAQRWEPFIYELAIIASVLDIMFARQVREQYAIFTSFLICRYAGSRVTQTLLIAAEAYVAPLDRRPSAWRRRCWETINNSPRQSTSASDRASSFFGPGTSAGTTAKSTASDACTRAASSCT